MPVCAICKMPIEEASSAIGFPPIFFNTAHPHMILSDAPVHRACLDRLPFRDHALAKLADAGAHAPGPRMCRSCGEAITTPDELFATGRLSDFEDDPIRAADWVELHTRCIAHWDGIAALVRVLDEVNRSGEWEGDTLRRLLDRIARARSASGGTA